jgi:tryptophan-rich sensory protein
VWSVLYLLIIVSFGYVFWRWWQGTLPTSVMLIFAVNLAANIAFSPVQFWLRSNVLASVDVLVVLASLGYAMYRVYPLVPWVTYMNIPYLAWVSFASVLQLTVTYLNLGK